MPESILWYRKKDRIRFLEYIKKQYDIYGFDKPENFKNRMQIIREAVLLAPNFTKENGNKYESFANDRISYLDQVEQEVKEKNYILLEWEFDSFVFLAPNIPSERGTENSIDAFITNWKAIHDGKKKPEKESPFKKNFIEDD